MKRWLCALAMVLGMVAGAQAQTCYDSTLVELKIPDSWWQVYYEPGGTPELAVGVTPGIWWTHGPTAYGVKIPVMYRSNVDGNGYIQTIVEYDSERFTLEDVKIGPAFPSSYTNITVNENYPGPILCDTNDEGHDSDDVLVQMLYYGSGDYPAASSSFDTLFSMYFTVNGMEDSLSIPAWSGWETSAAFVIKCGPTYLGLRTTEVDLVGDEDVCVLQWGDDELIPDGGCMLFDMQTTYYPAPSSGHQVWCTTSNAGNTCISCPGCNYWGECWDEDTTEQCMRDPYAPGCNQLSKPIEFYDPTTWSKVKGLYKD